MGLALAIALVSCGDCAAMACAKSLDETPPRLQCGGGIWYDSLFVSCVQSFTFFFSSTLHKETFTCHCGEFELVKCLSR